MGLFSFLKKAGAKIFEEIDKPAREEDDKPSTPKIESETVRKRKLMLLYKVVESLKIKVDDLSIHLNDDQVKVEGAVESQSDKEKIILTLGNVEGIATVDDRVRVIKQEPEAEFYEVKKGDSLSKIAKRYYGDPMKYKIIFEANQPMLKDPDRIYPGQMLRIPRA